MRRAVDFPYENAFEGKCFKMDRSRGIECGVWVLLRSHRQDLEMEKTHNFYEKLIWAVGQNCGFG